MKIPSDSIKGLLIHLALILGIFIVGLLVFFYGILPSSTNHGETLTVPDLEGLSMENIDEFLTKRNLRYEINDSVYTEEFPPLTIIKQYPKAGAKVKENRKIFISVNRVTPPTVPMPDLVEKSFLNAQAVLKSNELKLGEWEYKTHPFHNLVLEMRYKGDTIPAGQLIPKGSVINLTVGRAGGDSFTAPNLMGYSLEDASLIVTGSNLEVGVITVDGDTTLAEPVVYKQDPMPGMLVRAEDLVNLWIAPKSDTLQFEDTPAVSEEVN